MPPYKPYASKKQEAWAHTASGLHNLGVTEVEGKDQVSKGRKLPKRSKKKGNG